MRALRLYTAAFYAFMFAPLVVVVLFSFNNQRSLQNFGGFSLEWYRAFRDSESLRGSLIASIEIALVTMVVGTVLGRCWPSASCARARGSRPAPTC
jgi:ABC-type spermidine/putrescine transport system permease subunit II